MAGSFPANKPDWSNLEVIHRGTLEPRSYFFIYEDDVTALSRTSEQACALKLSGTWRFWHSSNPFDTPVGFEAVDYNTAEWSDIQVPGLWQLQGWGHPQYTNINSPIFIDPPNVPFDNNQTGCYVKTFTVPEHLRSDQYRLRFEGVDSAYHVWINGIEVGYSQGSRNASEFDVTALLHLDKANTLAVQVYQYCDGTYIEDQDQWRFSGIFRDVYLHAFPREHIKDFQVFTNLDSSYQDAELKVIVDVSGGGSVGFRLINSSGRLEREASETVNDGKAILTQQILNPAKWTAETPNLYTLVLTYQGRSVVQNVGFRKVEIKNGLYLINGKRIVFRGANRHEHHPLHGRAVPYEFMRQDLLLMKRHNLNALRTCHQPSDPRLYALADELGLYVMDEADLECHGFAIVGQTSLSDEDQKKGFEDRMNLVYAEACRYTSDNPDWKDQYVDRARQLVMRDKNHPCVIMWSLGNEAFYGQNFQAMYDEIKSIDSSRPVHYEGDREARTVDLYSKMYPTVDHIIKFAQESNFTKPLVLCEFVHAMGNGPGAIKEYVDAFYRYPRLQGGWVWEWANHGLLQRSNDGDEFYAYGGDYGDVPNDYNFVMDGVLFSDHTPTPGLIEYAKAIEPVQVSTFQTRSFTITNRYDIVDLSHLTCEASLIADGVHRYLGEIVIPDGIAPHTSATVSLPDIYDLDSFNLESYLQLTFKLRAATEWASTGHIVSTSQLQITAARELLVGVGGTHLPQSRQPTPSTLEIKTDSTCVTFSLPAGKIVSFKKSGLELIQSGIGPEITLFRALTDNDRPQDGHEWKEKFVHLTKTHCYGVKWHTTTTGDIVVEVEAKIAPPVLEWCIKTITTYTFYGGGGIRIECQGKSEGVNQPATLPRIGLEFAMPATFDNVSWFGRGPGESYKDKKLSQHFGNWAKKVDDLWVDYEFPQEGGNRTDVRWVKFESLGTSQSAMESIRTGFEKLPIIGDLVTNQNALTSVTENSVGLSAKFGTQSGFSFNASHYTTQEIEESTHPYKLHRLKKDYILVRLDADHHGLGTGSCGPKTMGEYALKTGSFKFEVMLE